MIRDGDNIAYSASACNGWCDTILSVVSHFNWIPICSHYYYLCSCSKVKKNTCAERAYVKLSWLRFVHVDNPFFALRFFFHSICLVPACVGSSGCCCYCCRRRCGWLVTTSTNDIAATAHIDSIRNLNHNRISFVHQSAFIGLTDLREL